jgi:hypothetical protein
MWMQILFALIVSLIIALLTNIESTMLSKLIMDHKLSRRATKSSLLPRSSKKTMLDQEVLAIDPGMTVSWTSPSKLVAMTAETLDSIGTNDNEGNDTSGSIERSINEDSRALVASEIVQTTDESLLQGDPIILSAGYDNSEPGGITIAQPHRILQSIPAISTIRINAGSLVPWTDPITNHVWMADRFFNSAGRRFTSCPLVIGNTLQDDLYCTERYVSRKH